MFDSSTRTRKGDLIDIGSMQIVYFLSAFRFYFSNTSYYIYRFTITTFPYWQRCSPETSSRDISIWSRLESIDKSLLNIFWNEMDLLSSRNGQCFQFFFFYKPRFDCFVDQRRFRTWTMRIRVVDRLLSDQ